MGKNKQSKDRPLRAFVSRGVLTIEIGVNTLAFADEWRQKLENPDLHASAKITNANNFAKDVCGALLAEEEDGSSLLTNLFDRASEEAMNDGSEWVEYEDEP